MIYFKTKEEIEGIRRSCLLVSRALAEVGKFIRPGITTIELDAIGEKFIREHGGYPAFLGYKDFPNALCISVNEQVVHGIPGTYKLKEGDVVSVDAGVLLDGFYGDSAYTFPVGEINEENRQLLAVTRKSLELGVEQARAGKRIGDIAWAIQHHCEIHGFSVVRELVGHGLGRSLHEEPEVPNYGRRGSGAKIREGLVIAIEPMVNAGKKEVKQAEDGWTIFTADHRPSAHFEHTVAVLKDGPETLTTFDYIEEVIMGVVA